MAKLKILKSGLAALLAAASMSEAKADGFERPNIISAEAGYRDNNLQNGLDFTEGWHIGINGSAAIDIHTDMQLALGAGAKLSLLEYSDGCGYDRQIEANTSILFEWAPRWDSAAFNLGAGVQFNFIGDYASYENVQLGSLNIGAGPALEAFVGSEWVYAGLNFSTVFGGMGNNVQQYNDLVQYNLGLKLGFHLGPVDIEGYSSMMYNTATEGQINREAVFVHAGANAKFWFGENFGLTLGYDYLHTFADLNRIDGNKFNAGAALRF